MSSILGRRCISRPYNFHWPLMTIMNFSALSTGPNIEKDPTPEKRKVYRTPRNHPKSSIDTKNDLGGGFNPFEKY